MVLLYNQGWVSSFSPKHKSTLYTNFRLKKIIWIFLIFFEKLLKKIDDFVKTFVYLCTKVQFMGWVSEFYPKSQKYFGTFVQMGGSSNCSLHKSICKRACYTCNYVHILYPPPDMINKKYCAMFHKALSLSTPQYRTSSKFHHQTENLATWQ